MNEFRKTDALYVGSFNPFHNGHMHVALAALRFCDTLHICVAANPAKPEPEWRVRMGWIESSMRGSVPTGKKVVVGRINGLAADWCAANGIGLIVKGCRDAADFMYEARQADTNRRLVPGLETVIIPSPPELSWISSTLVREMAAAGRPVLELVSPLIAGGVMGHFGH